MFLCPLTTPENLKVFCLQGVEKLLLVFSQVVKWNPWPEVGKTLTWILLVSSSRVVSIFIHVFKFSMFTGDLKHPVFFQNVLEVLSSHCGTTCSLNWKCSRWNNFCPISEHVHFRGVYTAFSNICDEAFLGK